MTTRAGAVCARTTAVNHLKALIVSAPEDLRAELRGRTSDDQIADCAKLRDRPTRDLERRTTVHARETFRILVRGRVRPAQTPDPITVGRISETSPLGSTCVQEFADHP